MKCIANKHNGHPVKLLSDYIPEQKKELQRCVDILRETDFTKLTGTLQNFDTQIRENSRRFETLRESIKRQGITLKAAIDKAAMNFHKVNDNMEMKNVGILSTYRTELSKYGSEDKRDKLARCQRIVTNGTDEEVMLLAEGRGANSIEPPTPGKLTKVIFKPTTYHGSLKWQFGSLKVDGKIHDIV